MVIFNMGIINNGNNKQHKEKVNQTKLAINNDNNKYGNNQYGNK